MKLFLLFVFGVFIVELLLNLFATTTPVDSCAEAHKPFADYEKLRAAPTFLASEGEVIGTQDVLGNWQFVDLAKLSPDERNIVDSFKERIRKSDQNSNAVRCDELPAENKGR